MTEQDVRQGLHGAVAGEPPLDFDPDALVVTARREVRRRRALVSASLATAAIAVAAVAVPVVLGIARDQGGVAPADRPAVSSTGPATSAPERPTPGSRPGSPRSCPVPARSSCSRSAARRSATSTTGRTT